MADRAWRLILSGAGPPDWNLACDEALLRSSHERPVLRLYGWRPAALSLGRFQPLEPFLARAERAGVPIVRRPTGGGAIHHDREVTFCIVATPGRDGYPEGVVPAYEHVHAVIARALATLGARVSPRGGDAPLSVHPRAAGLCFEDATALDLVDERGAKVVGSAQRRVGARVLHHGSIPLEVPALSPDSGCVSRAAGRTVSRDELCRALVQAVDDALCASRLAPSTLSRRESELAESLRIGRYADPALVRG